MSAETAYLALLLDAPLQSWGFSSRFEHRTTWLYPTKSGVIGLILAAMGLAKGSKEEKAILPELAKMMMSSIAVPRLQSNYWGDKKRKLPVRRLEDFHTVRDTRRASGSKNPNAVVTRRQYLLDARFGVVLKGEHALLEKVASALQDPRWGVWLGRKSCIPAEPIYRGLYVTEDEALRKIIGPVPLKTFTVVAEVACFDEGTDTLCDQPLSFGDGTSSGQDKRRFAVRRVAVRPGQGFNVEGK